MTVGESLLKSSMLEGCTVGKKEKFDFVLSSLPAYGDFFICLVHFSMKFVTLAIFHSILNFLRANESLDHIRNIMERV